MKNGREYQLDVTWQEAGAIVYYLRNMPSGSITAHFEERPNNAIVITVEGDIPFHELDFQVLEAWKKSKQAGPQIVLEP